MSKLALYTRFSAHPEQRDRLIELLLDAARLMDNAPGCALYIVNTSPDDAGTVWVTEVWESPQQHRASLSIEGVSSLIEQTMPLLAAAPEQIRLTPVGGKGLAP